MRTAQELIERKKVLDADDSIVRQERCASQVEAHMVYIESQIDLAYEVGQIGLSVCLNIDGDRKTIISAIRERLHYSGFKTTTFTTSRDREGDIHIDIEAVED